jgi:hypothetical protein
MAELALFVLLLAGWGAPAVAPWRLAGAPRELRRAWAWTAPTLLLAAAVGAFGLLAARPDQAVGAGLAPLGASLPGRLLLPLVPALFAATLVAAFAWERLEGIGWRILAALGVAALGTVAWAWERLGEPGEPWPGGEPAPAGPPWAFVLRVGCRAALALGAGELLAPGRAVCAPLAGLALPLYFLLLPGAVRLPLWQHGGAPTLAAATLVLLAARWLPASLRRPALAAGALLAAAFLVEADRVEQLAAPLTTAPLPPLSRP